MTSLMFYFHVVSDSAVYSKGAYLCMVFAWVHLQQKISPFICRYLNASVPIIMLSLCTLTSTTLLIFNFLIKRQKKKEGKSWLYLVGIHLLLDFRLIREFASKNLLFSELGTRLIDILFFPVFFMIS